MEINANIYIITDNQELMEKTVAILSRETDAFFVWETVEPHPILPLTRTWYICDTGTGPTTDPGGWEDCLRECAALLKNRGAVIMRFRSPDHPEDYCEYANTTARGDVAIGKFAFVDERGWERMLLEDEDYEAPPLELLTIPTAYSGSKPMRWPIAGT